MDTLIQILQIALFATAGLYVTCWILIGFLTLTERGLNLLIKRMDHVK